MTHAPTRLGFVASLFLSLAACGGGEASTGSSASADTKTSSAPASSSASTSASAAPAAPPAAKTSGEVEMRDKKKVAFSIELPEGLKDVSEQASIKRYALEAKKYDGYSFQIMEANPKWAEAGLDKMLEEAEKSPDAKKNNAKILDKGTTDTGWYFASSIEENKKKAVILVGIAAKGDVKLMCRGNVEGPLAEDAEKSAAVIVKACKSLTIN